MANPEPSIRLVHATPPTPGAIAILQLIGDGCENLLHAITGVRDWPIGRARLVSLAGIDDGLAVMLAPRVAQLMPHGGPRVVQRLTARLLELGVDIAAPENPDPRDLFPEAEDRFEALMLVALSRAASGLAINLLLDQPRRWRESAKTEGHPTADDLARSRRLNRLIDPPMVVLAGEPNVGKSTLSNALFGRAMSIAADMPGTTRDYITGRIDLAGLAVDWHDTPGIRDSADAIERKAIDIAQNLMERADVLIAMRDAESDWPRLPRQPDLQVINKCDERGEANVAQPLRISALHGHGLAALVTTLRNRLIPPEDFTDPRPWLFDPRLQQ